MVYLVAIDSSIFIAFDELFTYTCKRTYKLTPAYRGRGWGKRGGNGGGEGVMPKTEKVADNWKGPPCINTMLT